MKTTIPRDAMVPKRHHVGMAMQLRLLPEEDEMLDRLAAKLGTSKNQAVAYAVHEAWSKQQSRAFTHAALDAISAERKELLGRLAQ